jgi:CheY-like chemotaxis protein
MNSHFSHGSPSLRVFVVENHPDTLESLQAYLEELGHTVTSARSMTEALSMLPNVDCDLLISDIGLPDGDGWELLERAELADSVCCVAMSGFGLSGHRARSKAAGYRHHLLKPFNPEELDAILDQLVRERCVVPGK